MYGMSSLGAAIWQENSVRSARGITVSLLVLAKVGAAVLVMHAILKGIVGRHGFLLVALGLRLSVASGMCLVRCRVVWGMVIREGRGQGDSSKEESGSDDRGLKEGTTKHWFSTSKS